MWAQLWLAGLVALQHVGSSRTRDQTRVPCIGRRILNHCATREVPEPLFFTGCSDIPKLLAFSTLSC